MNAANADTKQCSACQQHVLLARFTQGRNVCNSCKNAAAKKRGHEMFGSSEAVSAVKQCNACHEVKNITAFEHGRAKCKQCRTLLKHQTVETHAQETTVYLDGRPHVGSLPQTCKECDKPFTTDTAGSFRYRADLCKFTNHCLTCINDKGYSQKSRAARRARDEAEFLQANAIRAKHYRDAHPEVAAVVNRKRQTSANHKLVAIRCAAKQRGKHWAAEDENAMRDKLAQTCTYCDRPADAELHGLDRIDNALGYTDANTTACCYMCNMMKRDFDAHAFLQQCVRIANVFQRGQSSHDVKHSLFEYSASPNSEHPNPSVQDITKEDPASAEPLASKMHRPKQRMIHHPESQGRRISLYNAQTRKVAHIEPTVKGMAAWCGISAMSAHSKIKGASSIWVAPHWLARDFQEGDEVDPAEHADMLRHLRIKGPVFLAHDAAGTKVRYDTLDALAGLLQTTPHSIKTAILRSPNREWWISAPIQGLTGYKLTLK
jgi:hypothetical protein